jgi:hypothetical protein
MLLALIAVLATLLAGAMLGARQLVAATAAPMIAQQRNLALAREALLGDAERRHCLDPLAALDSLLVCPDGSVQEGVAAPACPGTSRGWLPWRTLNLPPLRDASGTCLWIERLGATVRVIAPGAARPGQQRAAMPGRVVCEGHLDAADYLDPDDVSLTLTLDAAALTGICP